MSSRRQGAVATILAAACLLSTRAWAEPGPIELGEGLGRNLLLLGLSLYHWVWAPPLLALPIALLVPGRGDGNGGGPLRPPWAGPAAARGYSQRTSSIKPVHCLKL